ncbi:TIGR03986 family CRISPR-associated RAMP protein [Micromonospora sp. RTGN7]|uniref:TIGR03986 family type III CRISPR-associated RAMP protein n=1 Tax=Micromonospora sp. RTGN7 TaxID=3016526 RepID=UPI0029FEFBC0|nr:TIGR03986 family CRISPR-associated RAMP protein [Micromonospora sp. RTGN7]
MSTPKKKLTNTVVAELTKRGDVLEGIVDKPKPTRVLRKEWDSTLAEHVDGMHEGESVKVKVTIDQIQSGTRTVRLAEVVFKRDVRREKTLQENGGFVNPYTFVPTPPRTGLAGTSMGDAGPASHARIVDGQWSGSLALTLTTVTPLLLPVPAATQPDDKIRTFDVRVDADGQPLIHGASLKGALRSAYETITASRYGVFFEHHERLAYRVPPDTPQSLTPARVMRPAGGTPVFRLCRGATASGRPSRSTNQKPYVVLVPAYGEDTEPVRRLGELAHGPLTRHHGHEVHALVVQSGRDGQGKGGSRAPRATHLAHTEAELQASLRALSGRPDNGQPRIVRGWLSATGRSIDSKRNERLFVETPGLDVPLTDEHVEYWESVLLAYDLAHGYHDPRATYRRDPATAEGIERSLHVPSTPDLRKLPDGTLVYVKYDDRARKITEVHPVMIGRLPFDAAPGELLHESLRPAQSRKQLSPADHLFGWVPPGRRDDDASGYRGRLRVRSITCTTGDWRPASFPPEGVTLAPLSSPKPTQFRFYAASHPETGMPMQRGAAKSKGYTTGTGLRGRKMYRWREEEPEYWQPDKHEGQDKDKEDKGKDAPAYLASEDQKEHATQLVRHESWVRPGVTFQVELFLDGVRKAELGPLLWLLTRGTAAPLRLGAGKPYGFGVVTARLDADRTRLWDADGTREGWLSLNRPAPVDLQRLTELAEKFHDRARNNEVLHEATESYLTAAAPVTEPVHYPRVSPEPQAESYEWFVENDRIEGGEVAEGWPLPHVRDPEQRLPYLPKKSDDDSGDGNRGSGKKQPGRKPDARSGPKPNTRSVPKAEPRSVPRQGGGSTAKPSPGHGTPRPGPAGTKSGNRRPS